MMKTQRDTKFETLTKNTKTFSLGTWHDDDDAYEEEEWREDGTCERRRVL